MLAARLQRSTPHAYVFPLVVVVSLLCGACRRTPKAAPAAVDAGTDASQVTAAPLPFSGRIIARSVGIDLRLVRMKDEGLLVLSGPGMWSVGPGDTLQRIGTPADATALLLPGDDELGGFEARPFQLQDEMVWGPAATPFVKRSDATVLHWTGKEWTKTAASPMPERHIRYAGAAYDQEMTKGLPEGYEWRERSEATKGIIVWLGSRRVIGTDHYRTDELFIGPTAAHPARAIAFPAEHAAKFRSCEFIESADDHTYVTCIGSADVPGDSKHFHYVLEGERWKVLDLPIPESGERAFDSEGALWYVRGGAPRGAWLARLTPDTLVERFDPPAPPEGLSAPGYRSDDIPLETTTQSPSHTEVRHWTATTLVPAAGTEPLDVITQIIPRRTGEVWVLGYDVGRDSATGTILRFARRDTGPAPMLVRSGADERRSAQEARGIRNWTGNCNTVFIPFPRGGSEVDAGEPTSAFYEEHKAAIDKAVATTDPKSREAAPLEVAIVDGHLEGRRVSGILFIQSDPEVDDKRFVNAIRKIGEIATPNPASPPAITCTLPELDRIVKRLRTAEPRRY